MSFCGDIKGDKRHGIVVHSHVNDKYNYDNDRNVFRSSN